MHPPDDDAQPVSMEDPDRPQLSTRVDLASPLFGDQYRQILASKTKVFRVCNGTFGSYFFPPTSL